MRRALFAAAMSVTWYL